MPNFFCGSLVVVRCGPQGFFVLLVSTDARSTSRDRLRAMPCQKEENERSEVKSAKTIRMSLSREQPPARVERAQQEQDFTAQKHAPFRLWRLGKQHAVCPRLRTPLPASRSGHAGCRLFLFRCKRECGGLKTASRGDRRLLCFLLVPDASLPPRNAANNPGPMPKP